MRENIKVRFKGVEYWWLKDEYGKGALAPLEHCDDEGNILVEHMFSVSFAHVYPEMISRFGEKIGTVEDLEFLSPL